MSSNEFHSIILNNSDKGKRFRDLLGKRPLGFLKTLRVCAEGLSECIRSRPDDPVGRAGSHYVEEDRTKKF